MTKSPISHNIPKNDRDRITSFFPVKEKIFEKVQWKTS